MIFPLLHYGLYLPLKYFPCISWISAFCKLEVRENPHVELLILGRHGLWLRYSQLK